MAWSGFRGPAGDSGLELSLGLPAYFSKPAFQPGLENGEEQSGAAEFAPQSNGGASNGYSKPKPASAAAAPVVGWPPVRSFRRNLASSKPSPQSSSLDGDRASKDEINTAKGAAEARRGQNQKGVFVKINMDGVPIGRKIELKAHGGYAGLSAAVHSLFRGLLAAQRDLGAGADGELAIAGGEYTLVYEDDEGDRMLVGDVPWQMFIATAKRLRVLKSSDLPASSLTAGSRKRRAAAADC